jgi:hypothetical protein
MPSRIVLVLEGLTLRGELADSPVARAVAERLPLTLAMNRWGDEYYAGLGASLGEFTGPMVEVLEVGELAYWEPGNALCLFFGPTPVSQGEEPRAASAVHRLGRVHGDWRQVKDLGLWVSAVLDEDD